MKRFCILLLLPFFLTACEKTNVGTKAVDMGTSVLWSYSNAGAFSPEDYGNTYTFEEATALTDGVWRMPTRAEYQELVDSCDWTYESSPEGWRVTAPNGNSLFFRMINLDNVCYRVDDQTIFILSRSHHQLGDYNLWSDGSANDRQLPVRMVREKL